ncbi:glycosyltransferase family 4 protein [Aureisphaera galaxeae]|uniref:glycosyltransferase family 4 protein n=1 Tax=Aureisphaera galaxeae TaxID=1538023 RepID=UPI0023506B16|nr:glycosyltransferase family 4 protein [Aureisphaera galaxeae]MDC8003944.1 glycosyltransferase family 4 protein [Aureisphaera galaxeae]
MKRVLIICYYWPPAGGPGVQRWLKFVKYFKEFGIDPVVFVPENAHYPLQDESFESEVPSDIEIIKFPIKEPYRFAKWFSRKKTQQISSGIITERNPSRLEKFLLYVRGNLFIPDARVGWVKPSVRFLKKHLPENKIDTIITTGPPHSLHLIGLKLSQLMKVKWIADFRDPWTTIHYHQSLQLSKASANKHKRLESEVLNTADRVVVTSWNTQKEFSEITNQPIAVVTNGFDAQETIQGDLDKKFSIVHVGSLLSNRNPEVLWKVLADLVQENEDFKKALQIKLIGAVGDEIRESIQNHGLRLFTEIPGYVSHSEALQLQHKAQVLLLVEMDKEETKAIIPGKLFEYLRAERPIVALGPEGSDIKRILDDTQAGQYFGYEEEQELKQEILQLFDNYQHSTLRVASQNISQYSRRELTRTMADLIKSL